MQGKAAFHKIVTDWLEAKRQKFSSVHFDVYLFFRKLQFLIEFYKNKVLFGNLYTFKVATIYCDWLPYKLLNKIQFSVILCRKFDVKTSVAYIDKGVIWYKIYVRIFSFWYSDTFQDKKRIYILSMTKNKLRKAFVCNYQVLLHLDLCKENIMLWKLIRNKLM